MARGAALLSLAAALAAAPAGAATLDYLQREANEGGSSGGHVALRLGAQTFHFQNHAGLLRLTGDDSRRFAHDYALLENRPIHVSRIELDAQSERRLREHFRTRLRVQGWQLEALAALRAERELLELLERMRSGRALERGLALRGAGYFAPPGAVASDPALAALRARVLREGGADFPARRRAAFERELAALVPDAGEAPAPRLTRDRAPALEYGFGARYADLTAQLAALEVLADARGLREDALREGGDPELRLSAAERERLAGLAAELEGSLARLAAQESGEAGSALLAGMARLAALERSLREGRLRVLDAFPEDARRLEPAALRRQRALLPAAVEEARGQLAAARAQLLASAGRAEAAWSDVEDTANRYLEVARAAREGAPLRVAAERLVPARSDERRALVLPDASPAALARAGERAGRREQAWDAELRRLYGYDLLARNCVSALFETVHAAFDPAGEAARALGGRVDGRSGLGFVPFVSARQVAQRWRVRERWTIPSLRGERLSEMRRSEGGLRVALRESFTLSARAWTRGSRDSFFLFFTDELFWARPLLGAANLAAGLGEASLGLLRAPFDRGRTLRRGVEGALMSLPELAFVNLRKGTNDWVPAGERERRAGGHRRAP
jgi:hypothetical protein